MVGFFHITAKIDIDEMVILFIRAANEIAHYRYGAVRDHRKLKTDRSDISWNATDFCADFFFVR